MGTLTLVRAEDAPKRCRVDAATFNQDEWPERNEGPGFLGIGAGAERRAAETSGRSRAERLILIGDQNQLPPVVASPKALEHGLGVSLFARLAAGGIEPVLLDEQHRMHPKIAEFPSLRFYNGKVKSRVRPDQRPLPSGFHWPNPKVPVCFIDVGPDLNKLREMEADESLVSVPTSGGFESVTTTGSSGGSSGGRNGGSDGVETRTNRGTSHSTIASPKAGSFERLLCSWPEPESNRSVLSGAPATSRACCIRRDWLTPIQQSSRECRRSVGGAAAEAKFSGLAWAEVPPAWLQWATLEQPRKRPMKHVAPRAGTESQ